ncbi:hypothetical protein NX059_003658 [Plenodomus lindquistii]|nr:hypothetical protein NX059_003658 [Plenodomus lindquistii]
MAWTILDCANSKVNCTVKIQPVQANPDIAGIGVIVAFLSATCLAFMIAFTVMFLDRYALIVNFMRRHFTKNKTEWKDDYTGSRYWRSPFFWFRVLSKNLLAISDTQLLTGLAIQFTAMLKHCEMSVYHFRIVTELAFLTTVTHLLTVIALRNYFVKNKWINLPRVFFMLGNLGLLGYTSFVSYSYDLVKVEISQSLACFFQSDRPPFTAAFGGKWALLLVGAIGGHATIILAMYWLEDPYHPKNPTDTSKDEHKRKKWWYRLGAALRTWIVGPVYSIYGLWMAGDGLRHTQALGKPNVDIQGDEREWGFGQFLPVLLLALPIFAGWESFWEEKDPDRENYFGRRGRGSRSDLIKGQVDVVEMFSAASPRLQGEVRDVSVEERDTESTGSSTAVGRADAVNETTSSPPVRQASG